MKRGILTLLHITSDCRASLQGVSAFFLLAYLLPSLAAVRLAVHLS